MFLHIHYFNKNNLPRIKCLIMSLNRLEIYIKIYLSLVKHAIKIRNPLDIFWKAYNKTSTTSVAPCCHLASFLVNNNSRWSVLEWYDRILNSMKDCISFLWCNINITSCKTQKIFHVLFILSWFFKVLYTSHF